jgi:hypothetical protein
MSSPQRVGRRVGRDVVHARDLFVLDLSTAYDLPDALKLASPKFACLLAWDATQATVEEVSAVARKLLDAGAVYVCWGPDCERVHDIFDEEAVGSDPDPTDDSVMTTTWHAEEPLAEAIFFAIELSMPDETDIDDCRSTIGISIGSTALAEEIRQAFSR